ncbi:MAG: hypothetical protein HFF27_00610 [Oscillospiraceae bacterium]|nr:hypothetical protein [Oscillospiraceae bacterium]
MPFGKPKAPKEPKPPKAPKEKKPKKPKKEKPPKAKKGKKGQPVPEEVEGQEPGQEQEQGKKKKLPLPFLLISLVVIVAAAVIVFLFVLPKLRGEDPDVIESVEPSPPVLPTELPVGDNTVPGMVLGSDEYLAQAVLAKTITYTYTDLTDAGKVAETYVGQLKTAETKFSLVDEEFVRLKDEPDFTAAEGMVLMARNLPKPEPETTPEPEPTPEEDEEGKESGAPEESAAPSEEPSPEPTASAEPVEEPPDMVLTVRITWSPGKCVVTADEEEGRVTSPPSSRPAQHPVTQRGAAQVLKRLDPAMLGLPGQSMEGYEVIPMDGTELVDGLTAIRMHVYSDDNASGTNDFMGSYLMTIDGDHLYRVDPNTDAIIEVEGYEYTP